MVPDVVIVITLECGGVDIECRWSFERERRPAGGGGYRRSIERTRVVIEGRRNKSVGSTASLRATIQVRVVVSSVARKVFCSGAGPLEVGIWRQMKVSPL